MNINRKKIAVSVLALGLLGCGFGAWRAYFSPTKVAFLNFQISELQQIAKANNNAQISVNELSVKNIGDLDQYDMLLVSGMGLKLTEEQRELLKKKSQDVPVYTRMATNPDNNICTVDSIDADFLSQYIQNGGRSNYRSMLQYIRKYVDGKKYNSAEPDMPAQRQHGLLSHFNLADEDADAFVFQSLTDYNKFLADNNLLKKDGPNVLLTGQMGSSLLMTKALEKAGMNVYRVERMKDFIKGRHADSLKIDAVVNMAHGRMGDFMVSFLKEKNIPLFSPVNVNRLYKDWMDDKQGMQGGFLSQSIVTPEIDGAVRSWTVFANMQNSEGLQVTDTVSGRMHDFVQNVSKYLKLKTLPNKDKRLALFYFKGPGQNALSASGLEVVPSLYQFLLRLKTEGFDLGNLPGSEAEFQKMIMAQGAVFGTYAQGAYTNFIEKQSPALVSASQYSEWTKSALSPNLCEDLDRVNGLFPGRFMANSSGQLAVARLQFGNVLVLPQLMAGEGDDAFQLVHGANVAPPHAYIAPYLYARYAFKADALIHFGTHGSLEYTPRKQVALGNDDWSDRLIGPMPHFYLYTIDNVGEAMIAKRRTYAQIQSHITPPFRESELRDTYKKLNTAVSDYTANPSDANAQKVKTLTEEMGIASELHLDGKLAYDEADIQRVEQFAEELANEKITGQLYTLGKTYGAGDIETSVYAMATDPVAYGLLALDKLKGRNTSAAQKHKQVFTNLYVNKAKKLVTEVLAGKQMTDMEICRIAGITAEELETARKIKAMNDAPDALQMMMQMQQSMPMPAKDSASNKKLTVAEVRKMHTKGSHHRKVPQMSKEEFLKMEQGGRFPEKMMDAIKKEQRWYKEEMASAKAPQAKKEAMARTPKYTRDQIDLAQAIMAVEVALTNVNNYKEALMNSPETELASFVNALAGGYTAPSSGGDPIVNPQSLPTGRNLFSINVENTPSEDAWKKAKELCDNTIEMYRKGHNGEYPRKVNYTLWSSEFIETGGATIAQALYMLGVEPVRDAFGRVQDVRLIPSSELGRPRIDVVVQTSGQLRDLAASRLNLIHRAVQMAAEANDDKFPNLVKEGVDASEELLVCRGMTPKEARLVSRYRIFGGVNGNYGTGIQGMVLAGDKWDDETQIAKVYLNNMGAFYGDSENWESFQQNAFEAALTRTDVVVQPRQSNTWGALSLDHVYEFMGGANLAIRNVTGKEPDAYLADYRNHQNMRMQEVKEAIGVESRTTILNPAYIREKMKGGASSAGTFAEVVTNTYAWNVMKPEAIDNRLWDEIYNVYVKDQHKLGTQAFFEKVNPAALQEMTAVMLETVRKGMWKATDEQVKDIANLHAELVNKHKPACSGFVCDNAKLRTFIANKADAAVAQNYQQLVEEVRNAKTDASTDKGMVMKKEELHNPSAKSHSIVSGVVVLGIVAVAVGLMVWLIRKRKNDAEY